MKINLAILLLASSASTLLLNAYAAETAQAKSGSTAGEVSTSKNAIAITDEYSPKKVRIATEQINAIGDNAEYEARISNLINANHGNNGNNGGDRFIIDVLAGLKQLDETRFNAGAVNIAKTNSRINKYLAKINQPTPAVVSPANQ